jgi:hypothetical protein
MGAAGSKGKSKVKWYFHHSPGRNSNLEPGTCRQFKSLNSPCDYKFKTRFWKGCEVLLQFVLNSISQLKKAIKDIRTNPITFFF